MVDYTKALEMLAEVYDSGYEDMFPKTLLAGIIARELKTFDVYKINSVVKAYINTGLVIEIAKNTLKHNSYVKINRAPPKLADILAIKKADAEAEKLLGAQIEEEPKSYLEEPTPEEEVKKDG